MLTVHIHVSDIGLGFAMSRRPIDRHDVRSGDSSNFFSKTNRFVSSVFPAKSWAKSTFRWGHGCFLKF